MDIDRTMFGSARLSEAASKLGDLYSVLHVLKSLYDLLLAGVYSTIQCRIAGRSEIVEPG